jgi:hypothetical protein
MLFLAFIINNDSFPNSQETVVYWVINIHQIIHNCSCECEFLEFHGHGGTDHDLAGLGRFWCAVFLKSLEINGSYETPHGCLSRTVTNGNLRILNEIFRYYTTRYLHFNTEKVLNIIQSFTRKIL